MPRKSRPTKAQRLAHAAQEEALQRQKEADDARENSCLRIAARLCVNACPLIAGEDRLQDGDLSERIQLKAYQNRLSVASFLLFLGYSESAVEFVLSNKGMYGSDRMLADYWAELRDGTSKTLTRWVPMTLSVSDENLIASYDRSVAEMDADGMFNAHSNIVQRVTGARQDPHSDTRKRLRDEITRYLQYVKELSNE